MIKVVNTKVRKAEIQMLQSKSCTIDETHKDMILSISLVFGKGKLNVNKYTHTQKEQQKTNVVIYI